MHKLFIIEVIIYILGFILCVSSIFSSELFNLSSAYFKNNITGLSFGVYGECIHFVNGTKHCFLYSCSNLPELKDFCEDITECKFGLIISAIAFLIMNIMSLVRGILICYNSVWQEGICTNINVSLFGVVALIGTAIGAGSGAQASIDFLKIYPPGLITSTIGSGYTMIIIALICALLCLILQCMSCCNRFSRNNQPQIIYHYLPQPTDQQYINPLFQGNIIQQTSQPPPTYSSKA